MSEVINLLGNVSGVGFTGLPIDHCLVGSFGAVKKYDMGCIISRVCPESFSYLVKYFWVLIFLPIVAYIIIRLAWGVDQRNIKFVGTSIFNKRYLGKGKFWFYGWDSFEEFKLFVYEELLILACFIGTVMLYLVGGFEWFRNLIT